jgi:hypothetical protein
MPSKASLKNAAIAERSVAPSKISQRLLVFLGVAK